MVDQEARMRFIQHICVGEAPPRGYGVCWDVPWRCRRTVAPVPFCSVLRLAHWVYWGLAVRWLPHWKLEERLRRRYESYDASPRFPR